MWTTYIYTRLQKTLEHNILLTSFLHLSHFPPNLIRKSTLPAATLAAAVRHSQVNSALFRFHRDRPRRRKSCFKVQFSGVRRAQLAETSPGRSVVILARGQTLSSGHIQTSTPNLSGEPRPWREARAELETELCAPRDRSNVRRSHSGLLNIQNSPIRI